MDASDDKQPKLDEMGEEATPAAQTLSRGGEVEPGSFEGFGEDLEELSELPAQSPSKRFWTVLISASTVASFVLSFGISRMMVDEADAGSSPSVTQAAQTLEPAKPRGERQDSAESEDEWEQGESIDSLPKFREEKRRPRVKAPEPSAELGQALDQFRAGGDSPALDDSQSGEDSEPAESEPTELLAKDAIRAALAAESGSGKSNAGKTASAVSKAGATKKDSSAKQSKAAAGDQGESGDGTGSGADSKNSESGAASSGADDASCDPPTYRDANDIVRVKRHCLDQATPAE